MFQVGDRVNYRDNSMSAPLRGIITAIDINFNMIFVALDNGDKVQAAPSYFSPFYTSFNDEFKEAWDKLTANILKDMHTPYSTKCECGSHSIGVFKHSDWCPMWSKD